MVQWDNGPGHAQNSKSAPHTYNIQSGWTKHHFNCFYRLANYGTETSHLITHKLQNPLIYTGSVGVWRSRTCKTKSAQARYNNPTNIPYKKHFQNRFPETELLISFKTSSCQNRFHHVSARGTASDIVQSTMGPNKRHRGLRHG